MTFCFLEIKSIYGNFLEYNDLRKEILTQLHKVLENRYLKTEYKIVSVEIIRFRTAKIVFVKKDLPSQFIK
jgi:hypothetical protein